MTHIAIPTLFKTNLKSQMVKPEVSNQALTLLNQKYSEDSAYLSAAEDTFGAIKFSRLVSLEEATDNDDLYQSGKMKLGSSVSLHDAAVEIKFFYIEQTTNQQNGDGSLKSENAILELLEPMVFKLSDSRSTLFLEHVHNHMFVAGAIPGIRDSKPIQVQQRVKFTGSVRDGKIIVNFDRKPYGIDLLGYFAKVHREA